MPGWTEHRKWALLYGLSPKDAEKVDKFLDYPFGMNGPHTHIFHNPIGVALIRVMYGYKAALYAQQHILLDFRNRAIKQLLRELFDVQP